MACGRILAERNSDVIHMHRSARVFLYLAVALSLPLVWVAAQGPPATKPPTIADLSTAELLRTLVPWDGTFPLDESKRSPEVVAKISALDELDRRLTGKALSEADLD